MTETFRIYWAALQGFRRLAILFVVLMGLTGLFEGAALLALMPILNRGLGAGMRTYKIMSIANNYRWSSNQTILFALSVFILLGIFSAALRLASDSGVLYLRTRLERSLREKLTEGLLEMKWISFITLRIGDVNKGMVAEIIQASGGVQTFLQCLGSIFIVIVLTALAMTLSMRMTLFTIGFGSLGLLGYKKVSVRVRRHSQDISRLATDISNQVQQGFGNLKFLKSTALESVLETEIHQAYREFASAHFWSYVYGFLMRFSFDGGGILFISGFLAAALFVSGRPFAESLIFLTIFYRLAPRIMAAQDNFYQAVSLQAWYATWESRYRFVLSEKEEPPQGSLARPSLNHEIEARQLRFGYGKTPLLGEINWVLKKGNCLVLVGESGCGKTTMLDLVTGLLKPSHGQIRIDGIALPAIDLKQWRSKIGLVMPETPIFHGTVLENIAWGNRLDSERARRCAENVRAWEFIQRLPKGLDTPLEEKGQTLSQGERQRLALARALYRDPLLLILDEATSSLDAESEAIICSTLASLKGRVTILMSAHRLTTVHLADEILFLQAGQVSERGTWNELLAKPDGGLRRMATLQGLA